jgi:hypothetical protein
MKGHKISSQENLNSRPYVRGGHNTLNIIYINKAKGCGLDCTDVRFKWLTLVNTAMKCLLPQERRIYYIIRRLPCP